jgi:hypothetical protein
MAIHPLARTPELRANIIRFLADLERDGLDTLAPPYDIPKAQLSQATSSDVWWRLIGDWFDTVQFQTITHPKHLEAHTNPWNFPANPRLPELRRRLAEFRNGNHF